MVCKHFLPIHRFFFTTFIISLLCKGFFYFDNLICMLLILESNLKIRKRNEFNFLDQYPWDFPSIFSSRGFWVFIIPELIYIIIIFYNNLNCFYLKKVSDFVLLCFCQFTIKIKLLKRNDKYLRK
jgi:hypothetical protein